MFATMLLVDSRSKDDGVRYLRMRSPRVLSILFVDTKPIVTAYSEGLLPKFLDTKQRVFKTPNLGKKQTGSKSNFGASWTRNSVYKDNPRTKNTQKPLSLTPSSSPNTSHPTPQPPPPSPPSQPPSPAPPPQHPTHDSTLLS